MAKALYKWKVDEAPTGRYRSFQRRGWPKAYYDAVTPAAMIRCGSDYTAVKASTGEHEPLTLFVADHSATPSWKWRRLNRSFTTLAECKDFLADFLPKHPELMPEDKRETMDRKEARQ